MRLLQSLFTLFFTHLVTGNGTLTTTNFHEPKPSLHTTTNHHQPEPSLLTTPTHLQPNPSLTHLFPCINQTIPTQCQSYPSPLNLKHQPEQPPTLPAKASNAHQDSRSHQYSIPPELRSCTSTKQTSSTQIQITVPAKASDAHHDSGPPHPLHYSIPSEPRSCMLTKQTSSTQL